ncbi:phage tail protein I [Pseudomonas mandelii]|uniref:phage tail protein I n=1 Tax=Pseudomonas mandelii TaxID=75612 RepID=UPI00224A6C9D|nr:phage tail protein I [Pseudomonas mandelii]MCX2896794.1 phage tail protein I [Pseudomonas mandelii]
MSSRLLPLNSTLLERAVADAFAVDQLPLDLRTLWNVDECSELFLPHLAWSLSVDFWELATTDQQRRDLIRGALAWHRKRGTPWAIKQALTAIGYPGCELMEHRQLQHEWLDAGGELLDGSNKLDGLSNLSALAGSFRFATNHWAEYALRLNIAEGISTSDMLKKIAVVCEAYAPARSRLAAIIMFAAAEFEAQAKLTGFKARGRMVLKDCRRITVPSFDTLDGCDLLGGKTLADLLDGIGTLDGSSNLLPERYTGEPLDGGQLGITGRSRIKLCGTALGGNRLERPETLDSTDFLDGAYTIAGETLDGFGGIESGNLYYPTLADTEDTLDGSSNLGEVQGPDQLWFSGLVRIRRGSTVTQEAL